MVTNLTNGTEAGNLTAQGGIWFPLCMLVAVFVIIICVCVWFYFKSKKKEKQEVNVNKQEDVNDGNRSTTNQ